MLAVITEPQLHTISMYMKLGSLYYILHDLNSGTELVEEVGVVISVVGVVIIQKSKSILRKG